MRNILDKAKILVIDDFSDFRLSIKAMLTQLGAQHVDQASNGRDGIKLCEQNSYNIILCDYNLGEGQDGQQVLEELHQRNLLKAGALFIMVTAETSAAKVISAIEYQPDAYLTKPFTREQIARRLQRLLYKNAALHKIYQALHKNLTEEALGYCDQIAEEFPKVRYACLRIKSEILEKSEEYEQALKVFQKVIDEQPLLWAVIGIGRIYFKTAEQKKSLEHFQQAKKQFEGQVSILDWIAKCQNSLGEQSKAEQTIKEALKISPKSVTRQTSMGEVAESLSHFDVAQKAYGKAIVEGQHSCLIKPSHFSHYFDNTTELIQQRQGTAQMRLLSEVETQSKKMENLLQKQPSGLALNQAALARLFHAGGNKEKTIRYLNRLNKTLEKPGCELKQDDFHYIENILKPISEEKEFAQYTKNATKSLGLEPSEKVSEVDETSAAHQQAVSINHEGMTLVKQKKPLEAIAKFREAIAIFPENISYLLNAAQVILENAILSSDSNLIAEAQHYIVSSSSLPENDNRREKYQRLKDLLPDE